MLRAVYAVGTSASARIAPRSILFILQLFCLAFGRQARSEELAGDDLPQVQLINAHIERVWEDNGLRPSQAATSGEWCRRVYLDVVGRIPTVVELDRFLSDRGGDKNQRLVERLLGDEYAVEYTRYWSTVWMNLLI